MASADALSTSPRSTSMILRSARSRAIMAKDASPSAANPADLCGNQKFTAPSRWIIASTSTPSTRRLLDGVAMPVPHCSTEPARPRHRQEMI